MRSKEPKANKKKTKRKKMPLKIKMKIKVKRKIDRMAEDAAFTQNPVDFSRSFNFRTKFEINLGNLVSFVFVFLSC